MPHSRLRFQAFAALALAPLALGPASSDARAQAVAEANPTVQRLTHLEEQMIDLQVAIGALQSLAQRGPVDRPPAGPSGPPTVQGGGGELPARVAAIETQIMALTGQIEHLIGQLQQLQDASVGSGGQPFAPPHMAPPPARFGPGTSGALPPAPGQPGQDVPLAGFGTAVVTPSAAPGAVQPPVPGGGVQPAEAVGPGPATADPRLAALSGETPKAVYELAYGQLIQRDYAAAEATFRRFVETFPDDDLAGNAQYWLGETFYVRGRFKPAADAFLQSYRNYRTGSKAPDSLLKLGMTLNQLGEQAAACDTFKELATQYPDAPQHVRQRASAETQRAGC